MVQGALFEAEAKYSIDTNVIVSFLGDGDTELYPVDVFGPQRNSLETAIRAGRVIAARRVEIELRKWDRIERMKVWLHNHKYVFQDVGSADHLRAAKDIVNRYPAYGLDANRLGDLEVISLAKARGLTVVSLESKKQHRADRPKIPVVASNSESGTSGSTTSYGPKDSTNRPPNRERTQRCGVGPANCTSCP